MGLGGGGGGGKINSVFGHNNNWRAASIASAYFALSVVVLGSIGSFYARYMLAPNVRAASSGVGCREDNEGSWAVGVYYGESPFSLKPIEAMNIWKAERAAWPVANPVITCASLSDAGFPTNFVADPFLYEQGDVLYMFYEAKNSVTMQGDIGVSQSTDNGATWIQMGIALDEDWHLSFPYVFDYNGNIYMMPEGSAKGDVRLYRAIHFPLEWTLEKVILKVPLVDSVIMPHEGKFYLLGSDHSEMGTKRNGHLGIWHSETPLGPWIPHGKNPVYNTGKTTGARNGGRPFEYNGNLYRVGQDCSQTYGHKARLFRVEVLTSNEYEEVEVPLSLNEPDKGNNAWNGGRHHHMDVQRLGSGGWIAVLDGDRVHSGDSNRRFSIGQFLVISVILLVILVGILLGTVKCIVPMSWCPHDEEKRSDGFFNREKQNLILSSSKVRLLCSRLNQASLALHSKLKPGTCIKTTILGIFITVALMLTCTGVRYLYGGSGAQEPYPLHGYYSQFTLLTMTYDARLWNLEMYVKHYSRCASVREIVVIWNKGVPPKAGHFDSVVPVRIRVEEKNSLNNRFRVDPLIWTRAVLELDDDIMMACDDIERGFRVWREYPDRIVGFYPRLAGPGPLEYKGEGHARKHGGYNMILTGAAFMDRQVAFGRYWGEEGRRGREVVDRYFNCEDVLMNYLYANKSGGGEAVEYVRPAWVVDMSKFSGVAISRNTQVHYGFRSRCLREFGEMYGDLSGRKVEFGRRKDGWDT